MASETQILNSILEIPVKPETSFQVSRFESNTSERFDHLLQARVDSHRNETPPAASPSFEARQRPAPEPAEKQFQTSKDQPTARPHADHQPRDSRPVTPDREQRTPAPLHNDQTRSQTGEPVTRKQVNPFALPLEQLERQLNLTDKASGLVENANPVDALAGLFDTHSLNAEGSPAIDTLRELLAGLNIDTEVINQLVAALNNGDASGVQNILNALHGLLQASGQEALSPAAEFLTDLATNQSNPKELQALLVRAGLTQEEAQQVIQQVRTGNIAQPASDHATQSLKTAIDALASKLNSNNSSGTGNPQNGDSSGSTRNSSEGPRNFTGLAGEKLETLASLVAPDKAGNVQTNPLIAKPSASPLLNSNTSGQPVPGVLAEGTQAPAVVADAAAKGAEFVKPAVTETYNGRASMDKPITAQIIEKFTMRGFGNQREVNIKLDPPSLGTVRMNVSTSGETVRATIVAENNVVKSVIENNLSQLKDSITHQGVKIDSFNVLVGGNASHSAEGHQSALDYLGQLGRDGLTAHEQAEETVTLHRPIFLNENQSFSIFA